MVQRQAADERGKSAMRELAFTACSHLLTHGSLRCLQLHMLQSVGFDYEAIATRQSQTAALLTLGHLGSSRQLTELVIVNLEPTPGSLHMLAASVQQLSALQVVLYH